MAVKALKRVYMASLVTETTSAEEPPQDVGAVKKLKLIHHVQPLSIIVDENSVDVIVRRLSSEAVQHDYGGLIAMLQELVSLLPNTSNSMKIVAVISHLVETADKDILITVAEKASEGLVNEQDEESPRIHLQQSLLSLLEHLAQLEKATAVAIAVNIAKISSEVSPELHTNLLRLLHAQPAAFATALPDLTKFLASHLESVDSRVLHETLVLATALMKAGVFVSPSLYVTMCSLLESAYQQVRSSGMKALFAMSRQSPKETVPGTEAGSTSLLDGVFSYICNRVNDISPEVRILAAELMGEVRGVSLQYLEQTLDKKLKANMRLDSGPDIFSSGRQWEILKFLDSGDSQMPETNSLVSMLSCGALIHALEDEVAEVRRAGLRTLATLAAQHKQFSVNARDFFIDALSDEVESVCQLALDSIAQLNSLVTYNCIHVDVLVALFKSGSANIRQSAHNMFSTARLDTRHGLLTVISALQRNISQYPVDEYSVLRCAARLGANHPDQTFALLPQLVGLHTMFSTPEQVMTEPGYVIALVIVFNAGTPMIISALPPHILRHRHYIRARYPEHMPAEISSTTQETEAERTSLEQLMTVTISRISSALAQPALLAYQVRTAVSDLRVWSQLGHPLAPTSYFLADLLDVFRFILDATKTTTVSTLALEQAGERLTSLQVLYASLPDSIATILQHLRLYCQVIGVFNNVTPFKALRRSVKAEEYPSNAVVDHLKTTTSPNSELLSLIRTELTSLELTQQLLNLCPVAIPRLEARLLEPLRDQQPISFVELLGTFVRVVFTLNVTPPRGSVCVRVDYGNGCVDYFPTKPEEETRETDGSLVVRLRVPVTLSHCSQLHQISLQLVARAENAQIVQLFDAVKLPVQVKPAPGEAQRRIL